MTIPVRIFTLRKRVMQNIRFPRNQYNNTHTACAESYNKHEHMPRSIDFEIKFCDGAKKKIEIFLLDLLSRSVGVAESRRT